MIAYRIIILLLTTICLSLIMANILTFNFCIICMTSNNYEYVEGTIKKSDYKNDFNSTWKANQADKAGLLRLIASELNSCEHRNKQCTNTSMQAIY
ncbi:unnamed protein product [Thelazia callipaeda]|uniref:Uncharacterized protein n=1 Tax=Thelazia callipaeda TaxID=103827 RepID=A0A0N5D3R4_THECL|nr:unnamed protein product [Thelazia callipaeda]